MSHGLTTRKHSIHHSSIVKCLEIVGVSVDFRQFLRVAMASWKTVLTVNGQVLDYVHIRRGIFRGDSLSPLHYVIVMITMTTILRQTGLGYQTSKSAAKISHLLYMDDLKLYGKSSNELESLLKEYGCSAPTSQWNSA